MIGWADWNGIEGKGDWKGRRGEEEMGKNDWMEGRVRGGREDGKGKEEERGKGKEEERR